MQRSSSPYRAPSPYGHPADGQYIPHQNLPTGTAQVGPGSVTYTTSTGPDGRIVYHPFKAVAASYQTPSGVVSGIQWIPAEATTVLPAGGQLMNQSGSSEYSGSLHGDGYSHKDDHKSTQDWQRADEKRRKQEEKEAKRLREHGPPRDDSEYELQVARERDAQSSVARERRKSFNATAASSVSFPPGTGSTGYPTHPSVGTGYPSSPYSGYASVNPPPGGVPAYSASASGHNRKASLGTYPDITRQFNDLEIDRSRAERERKVSGVGRPRKYSTSEGAYERPRTISGNHGGSGAYPSPPGTYTPASGPYSNPKHVHPSGAATSYPSHYSSPSPNMRPSDIPYGTTSSSGYQGSSYSSSPARNPAEFTGRSTTPFPPPGGYPPGHILYDPVANNSNPRSRAPSRGPSRAPSPNPVSFPPTNVSPYIGKSPHMPVATIPGEPQQLPAPEAFSRPINAANTFVPFETLKIQDMEEVYDAKSPKMPSVLSTHDIYPEDWKRCMQDLGRSWTGQLPVPGFRKDGRPPRRSQLTKDLIELWNRSFFFPRGVELILYKGKERRTGPQAGLVESRLQFDDDDFSSSTSPSDSDLSDYDNRVSGPYGRPAMGQAEAQDVNRRRQDEKVERRRRRKERRARRKAKARDKTYSVFIGCLPRGPGPAPYGAGPQGAGPQVMPGGYSTIPAPGGYGAPAPGGYAAPHGPAYAVPVGYGPPAGYASPPAGYGTPAGIPVTRSHGYGGGY